jgi:hypothetical protein
MGRGPPFATTNASLEFAGLEMEQKVMSDILLSGLAALALHEGAHIAVARLQGLAIKHVGISWKGPYVVREPGSRQSNICISLAGPLMNVVIAMVFWHTAPTFALCNAVLGIFNFLPIPQSDGLRALRLIRNSDPPPEPLIAIEQNPSQFDGVR